MSWLTNRSAQSADQYRYIRFVGGRILQAKELTDLQDNDALREKYQTSAMFREGALLNVQPSIASNILSLALKDTAFGTLLVMVNGSFEAIGPQSLTLPTGRTNQTDTLYMHWVLWRVTSGGADGCLADPLLIDTATQEAVGERGQLQVMFSFDTTLSDEPIDSVRMISKSVLAAPVLQVVWTSGTPAVKRIDTFQDFVAATDKSKGVVTLSTSTSSVAAATDDPRLSDNRIPVDYSVYNIKVSTPIPTYQTTPIGSVSVDGPNGIDSGKLVFAPLASTVHDLLAYLYAKVTYLLATVLSFGNRITTLENRPGGSVDLSYHVGKPLGRAAAGGLTHEPTVRDTTDGWRHYGCGSAVDQQGVTAWPQAFGVYTQAGIRVGAILHNGDYVLENPALKAAVNRVPGIDLCRYSTLVSYVSSLATGGSVDTGGSGTPVSYVDEETPFGVIDGANASFTLGSVPAPSNSLQLFRNGLLQKRGFDYNLTGNSITFTPESVPQLNDVLLAWYRVA